MPVIIYPTLLQSANSVKDQVLIESSESAKSAKSIKIATLVKPFKSVKSNSWFDITERKNNEIEHKYTSVLHNYTYINTKIIVLKLDDRQQIIMKLWLDDAIDVYNLINRYIKDKLIIEECKYTDKNNKTCSYLNYNNFYEIVDFRKLRDNDFLKDKRHEICEKNKFPKETSKYQIMHCVAMYKSAYSNFIRNQKKENYKCNNFPKYIRKSITVFNITDLCKDRKRKNLVIEAKNVSKKVNTIFPTIFKEAIDSNILLNTIEKNSVLQLDTKTNKFIIITPYEKDYHVELEQNKKCGIDPGSRTFLTVYSPEATYEICTNTYKLIDKYHKNLDSLKFKKDNNIFSQSKYNHAREKYQSKLKNHINDLHAKSSRFILENFETINLEKISIQSIVSNEKGNISPKNKRRILALSHYRFRTKLQQMSVKWNNKVILINAYNTSKTCCNCGNIKKNLGPTKTYECSKCLLSIDRDINAAINIYHR